jgi:hypothetical protein
MKTLLTTLFVSFFSLSALSTHIMGGEIIAENNGGNNYNVLLTIYRDTIGIPTDVNQDFTVYDVNGNSIMNFSISIDPNANHPIFGFQNGSILPFFPYGVEIYFFSQTISLPGPGEYTIAWDKCCRNGAIQNLIDPLSNDMRLYTTVTVDASQTNSTPYFMVKPVMYLPVNTPWQYNPLPYDVNGDSLSWSLGTPHQSSNSAQGTPIAGYTAPPSDPTNPISIDPVTGTISWTASMLGNWVYTVVCEEYRNGVKIGEIRRDMQFIVLPSGNLPRFMNFNKIPTIDGYYYWDIEPGQYSELRLMANDQDQNDVVTFEAFGEPFLLSNPLSYTQQATGVGNVIETTLSWTPSSSEIRENPYLVVLRLMDGSFMMDEALFIRVKKSSITMSTQEQDIQVGKIFPNPANELVNIPLNIKDAGNVSIKFYNVYGQLALEKKDYFNNGNHMVMVPTELPSGQYTVSIDQDTKHLGNQSIIIMK